METKHFNHTFSSGIPLGVGDRYYGQDRARDFWHGIERAGRALYDFYGQSNILIKGGVVSQGSSVTKINVTAAVALCQYTVDIPNSFAALPPTATTATLPAVLTDMTAQTDFNLSTAGATLNGVAVNYLKLAYAETDGNTRGYAKKSGSYAYERIPGYLLTCTTVAPAANEVELARLTGDGSTTLTITRQTIPKNAETLQDKICPVGTLRSEFKYLAPSQNYPWVCLDTIATYVDVTTTVWDDEFIAYLRSLPIVMFDGTASPQPTYSVTNWAVSSNVATLTLSGGANELLVVAALSEDNTVHGSFTNWRTITTTATIGNIPAGTYGITSMNAGSRTFSFGLGAADGSGAVTATCEFYANRVAGSTTSARLFGSQGVSLMTPNDATGYHVNMLRRRSFFQGHIHTIQTNNSVAGTARYSPTGGVSQFTTGAQDPFGAQIGYEAEGANGTPRTGKETHGPSIVAHLYIFGRNYKL